VKSNLLKCPGILQSELDYSEPCVITTHLMTCIKDTTKINITKHVNEMLQLAKDNEKKPGQIFSKIFIYFLRTLIIILVIKFIIVNN